MVKSIAPFALSELLFIIVFVMVMIVKEEALLMLVFLVCAILLAVVGIYFASQGKGKPL